MWGGVYVGVGVGGGGWEGVASVEPLFQKFKILKGTALLPSVSYLIILTLKYEGQKTCLNICLSNRFTHFWQLQDLTYCRFIQSYILN